MKRKFTPREYQTLAVNHILETPRCALWAGMGMGKTVSTLTALDTLHLCGEDQPTLILAPLRVAKNIWTDEANKWDHLRHISVVPIVGNEKERRAALKMDASVYTCNYENLGWLADTLGDKWPFATLVPDESTKLKSFRLRQGGQRARALAQYTHTKVKRVIELTGTPSPNGLIDLWGQMWFLDKGERLGRTFSAFKDRWFYSPAKGGSAYPGPVMPFAHSIEQIQAALSDICMSINPADWFDLKEPIVTPVYVDLPPKARNLYDDMEKRMFMELEGHEVEAFGAAAKTMKCLQIANGAAYIDDQQNWKEIHDAKLQALEDIIEEAAGMPVLVAYHFKSDLARLQKTFPQGRVLDTNTGTIRDWNAGKIPVLFAHPASAGHGLNLQDGGNIIAFFGHWWDLEQYQQIIERIGPVRQMQAGHDRPVFIYHIVARDTVDELVMARRESKADVQDLLMELLKRRVGK